MADGQMVAPDTAEVLPSRFACLRGRAPESRSTRGFSSAARAWTLWRRACRSRIVMRKRARRRLQSRQRFTRSREAHMCPAALAAPGRGQAFSSRGPRGGCASRDGLLAIAICSGCGLAPRFRCGHGRWESGPAAGGKSADADRNVRADCLSPRTHTLRMGVEAWVGWPCSRDSHPKPECNDGGLRVTRRDAWATDFDCGTGVLEDGR